VKLRYTGPAGAIEHGGRRLETGDTVDVSDAEGEAILSRYPRVFARVDPVAPPPPRRKEPKEKE